MDAHARKGFRRRTTVAVRSAAIACAAVIGSLALPVIIGAQMAAMPGMPSADSGTGDAVTAAMGGGLEEMPHMRMTALVPAKPGDDARAATIAATLREALAPYADYRQALADGYRIFAARVKQPVYHFSSRSRGLISVFSFNPAKPTSLLYEKTGDSTYRLVGAMYTAPRRASLAELDARVPLSVAQWHMHTNWCLPPGGMQGNYQARGPDGRPLFGGHGSITTKSECSAAGGLFLPTAFGWMVHVYPFATDPAKIWRAAEMH
jgi:hypothetical protein